MIVKSDDVALFVALRTSEPRLQLVVTLLDPDRATVTDARTHEVLQHFRGIRKFVQSDVSNEIAGARRYLGEIETQTRSVSSH
jgi:hypothetical protein